MFTDVRARAALGALIEDFLTKRIQSDAFDEGRSAISSDTQDATVRWIADVLWFYYSDLENHDVRLDKAGYDQIERLRLVLISGLHLQDESRRHFHDSQIVAGTTIFGLAGMSPLWSWPHMAVVAGLVSLVLDRWRTISEQRLERPDPTHAYPFSGAAAIRAALARAPGFKKVHCPTHRPGVWAKRLDKAVEFVGYLPWSPLLLVIQAFLGVGEDRVSVVTP